MLLKGIGKDKSFFESVTPATLSTYGLIVEESFKKTVEPYILEELYNPKDIETGIPYDKGINKDHAGQFRTFTKEEFSHRYGSLLEYDSNMTESAAEYIVKRKQEKAAHEYIISKGRDGIVDFCVEFGISSAMSVFDPLVLYSALVPVSSPFMVSKLGKLAKFAYQGGVGGFIGGIASEPARLHASQLMQDNYGLADSAGNIALSTVGGGIIGSGIYGASRLLNVLKKYKSQDLRGDLPRNEITENLEEKLILAKDQLEDGKVLNLSDTPKTMYEAHHENVELKSIDDELKAFYGKQLDLDPNLNTDYQSKSQHINQMRFAQNVDFISKHKSVKVGFQELLHNTELRQKTISRKYLCDFYSDLEKEDLVHFFREMQDNILGSKNKKLELDCVKELSNLTLSKSTQGFTGSNIALRLAQTIHNAQKRLVEHAKSIGANIGWIDGYITRQTHSPKVLKEMGYAKWKDFIVPLLDLELTGNIDLEKVYVNLATGIHRFSGGGGGIENRIIGERKLHFSSPESWYKYNEVCGEYGFADSILMNLNSLGESIGFIEGLGLDPQQSISMLKSKFIDELKEKSLTDKIAANDLKFLMSNNIDSVLGHITGLVPENLKFANLARNLRTLKMMGSLGKMLLSSLPDIGLVVGELQNNGIGLIKSWSSLLSTFTKNLNSAKKKEFARMLGIATDSMLGSVYSRLHSEDLGSGKLSKMLNLFFKLNFMEWWDSSFKTSLGTVLSNNLAIQSHSWKHVNKDLKNILARYGIGESNWVGIKNFVSEIDGHEYVVPDTTELGFMVRRYLLDRVEHGIISANSQDKAFMFGESKPGTIMGEFLRFFWQFKQYPTLFIRRAMHANSIGKIGAHERSGLLFEDMKDSLNVGTIKSMSHLFLTTTLLGYVSWWAKSIVKGESIPDIDEDNASKIFMNSVAHGGGLGIFGDYIFKDYNYYGKTFTQQMTGAVLSDINPIVLGINRTIKGEMSLDEFNRLIKTYRSYIPAQNLFYTDLAIMYGIMLANTE